MSMRVKLEDSQMIADHDDLVLLMLLIKASRSDDANQSMIITCGSDFEASTEPDDGLDW